MKPCWLPIKHIKHGPIDQAPYPEVWGLIFGSRHPFKFDVSNVLNFPNPIKKQPPISPEMGGRWWDTSKNHLLWGFKAGWVYMGLPHYKPNETILGNIKTSALHAETRDGAGCQVTEQLWQLCCGTSGYHGWAGFEPSANGLLYGSLLG